MGKLSFEDKINLYNDRKSGVSISSLCSKYKILHANVEYLTRLIDKHGYDILRKTRNRKFTSYEKEQIINRVLLNNESLLSVAIDERTSMMKQNNYSEQELNLIMSERTIRIIDNASSIKYGNKYYVPIDSDTGEVVSYMRKTQCIVILTYNAELWCKIENNFYLLEEIEDRNATMKKEIDSDKPIERKKIIPPKNHPWRKNMMLR